MQRQFFIYTFSFNKKYIVSDFCFFENEYVQMIHSGNHTLFLKPNFYSSESTQETVTIDNVYLFR